MLFRESWLHLPGKAKQPAGGNVNRMGDALREHGDKEAERLVRRSLKSLRLAPTPEALATLPKSDCRKSALALLLRERTSVGIGWIAARLAMAKESDQGGKELFIFPVAGRSSAPHPAEPELPKARAERRALRSARRSAPAGGGWKLRSMRRGTLPLHCKRNPPCSSYPLDPFSGKPRPDSRSSLRS